MSIPKKADTDALRLAFNASGATQPAVPVHAPEVDARPISSTIFRVKLKRDDASGQDGSLTSLPTYTYTASLPAQGGSENGSTSDDDEILGTKLSPQFRSHTAGTFTPATDGMGYFDETGKFQLLMAFEARKVGPC